MNIAAMAQYRVNFFVQIVLHTVMIATLYSIWFIFFAQFPSVNGWQLSDTALLLGIVSIAFAFVEIFAEGVENLAETVATGRLDYYLLLPRPILWMVSVSESLLASIGTFIVGAGMLYTSHAITLARVPILLVAILLSTVILYNFILINNSLAFYFGNVERAVQSLTSTMWDLLFYPQAAFSGVIKALMMSILPAFFIGTAPVNLVKEPSWSCFLGLFGFAVLSTIIAYSMFSRGLRRYESGNLFVIKW